MVLTSIIDYVKRTRNEILGSWEAIKTFGSGIGDVFGKLLEGDLKGVAEEFGKTGKKSATALWEGYTRNDRQPKADADKLKKQEADKAEADAMAEAFRISEATRAEKEKAAKKAAADAKKAAEKATEEAQKLRKKNVRST
ncbi:hypothetical protein [Rufibacter latericius]|uniref:hypothetical protein n=1 Tax=Rufibacter latericius TaxID=2487040 RepID=UPI000F62A48E|nr:hypothetical protein [Rufibacter latericius]